MALIGPLAKTGALSPSLNLWLACVPIGFLFGYALQRTGMTDARKIAGTFYLRDLDVPVILFTAIGVAAIGLWSLGLLGLLDLQRVYFLPTYLVPMAVGGLLFGLGMVIGGYCPGTGLAALATGKLDALAFLLGAGLGTLAFGDLYPLWESLYTAGFRGVYRLDEWLGLELGPTLTLVVLVAVGGSLGLRRLQYRFWPRAEAPAPPGVRRLVIGGIGIGILLALVPTRAFFRITETAGSVGGWAYPWAHPRESIFLNPLEAGAMAYRAWDRLRIFDLRDLPSFHRKHLAGAERVTPAALEARAFLPGTVVLLYSQAEDPELDAAVRSLRKRGIRAFGIVGGFPALEAAYSDSAARGSEKQVERDRYAPLLFSQKPAGLP